jgi:Tfp pilus assembly protein PilN
MTRINLLPPEKIKAKRRPSEKSYLWLAILLPALVLVLLVFLYISASGQVSKKDKALKEAQTELTDWQNKNASLLQYKTRQDQISQREATVVTALQGRVYWARILNNIAITIPTDIWLTSLNGISGDATAPGTVQFTGYTLQCPNRNMGGFYGYFPDYKPVANWLERMAQIIEFQRVWLANAQPTRQGVTIITNPDGTTVTGSRVIQFSSTATLNMDNAAIGGAPKPVAPPTAAPSTTPSEGGSTE